MPAIGVLAACMGLPLAGAALAGRPLAPLWRFPPPLDLPRNYPHFSWVAFGLVVGMGALIGWPWHRHRRWSPRQPGQGVSKTPSRSRGPAERRFPAWGWAAIAWILTWWWLAWTRQSWFAWGQRYTFTPLWLGLILTFNALTVRRGGACLMLSVPGRWRRLFAASALFWWVFEWLNRFVENWHYLGVVGVGPWEYIVHSCVCFSTVLPAVLAVREWLGTQPGLQRRLEAGPVWPWLSRRSAALTMVGAGLIGLGLTGAKPLYFYPGLWAAPLLVGVGLSVLAKADGWWRDVSAGDWRDAGSWALAALVCGFFWEMWNLCSLAKWTYTVPFVQRWRIFEMPLLGYSGYLTFGLECALAAGWVLGRWPPRPDADEAR